MTIKLTYDKAVALKLIFETVIIPEIPFDVAESLLQDIMKQVYLKLNKKLVSKRADGYSITLTDIEGKAYYLYFQNRALPSEWHYETTMIDSHIAELDKQYA